MAWVSDYYTDEPVDAIISKFAVTVYHLRGLSPFIAIPTMREIRKYIEVSETTYLHVDTTSGVYKISEP